MPSLPREIWRHIAHFMSNDDLQPFLSLNSVFFDIVMDSRYRQMTFAYIDKRMVRNLNRLIDPVVAKRVRSLYIYLGFIDEAITNDSVPVPHSLLSRCMKLGSHLLHRKCFAKVKSKLSVIRMLQRTEDLVKIMHDVLSGLPNLSDYYVTWCGRPSIAATSIPFLSTVFRSSLRKLCLDLSLQNIAIILSPSFYINNLQELRLSIHPKDLEDPHKRDVILRKHLAPAISNLGASLHTLSIEPKEHVDLSAMFYAIQPLPSLKDLSISIPAQSPHLGDPEGLTHFLNESCSNLRSLHLRVPQIDRSEPPPDEMSFETWVREAICTASLPKLRLLEITSHFFPPAAAEACVRRFGCSIRSLTVTGHHRPYGRVEDLLNIILACQVDSRASGLDLPLEKLRLGVDFVSPQLMALFASKLPNLQRLELLAKFLVPYPSQLSQWRPVQTDGQKFNQIDNFLEGMQELILHSWQLRHMYLFVEHLPIPAVYKPILEEIFLQSIPSLKSFW